MERRRSHRLYIHWPVWVTSEESEQAISGRALNISMTGVEFLTSAEFEPRATVGLEIEISQFATVRCTGVISRVTHREGGKHTYGVKFTDFFGLSRLLLRDTLKAALLEEIDREYELLVA
jgi:hypothetical protein